MLNFLTYQDKAALCPNLLARNILLLLERKKTNLALSADLTTCQEVLDIADLLGPDICVLKTHVDILSDFTPSFTKKLQALAKKHDFYIFEDRKFADIGNTVNSQYYGGIYHIADWAHIINAHSIPGPGIIEGLKGTTLSDRGLLLLAEMSSAGHLMDAVYQNKTHAMAEKFPEFVIGFIAQKNINPKAHWIYMTPGVQFHRGGDTLGQQYIAPKQAIIQNGSDIIIVGRGILKAQNPQLEATRYRQAGWEAYSTRCEN